MYLIKLKRIAIFILTASTLNTGFSLATAETLLNQNNFIVSTPNKLNCNAQRTVILQTGSPDDYFDRANLESVMKQTVSIMDKKCRNQAKKITFIAHSAGAHLHTFDAFLRAGSYPIPDTDKYFGRYGEGKRIAPAGRFVKPTTSNEINWDPVFPYSSPFSLTCMLAKNEDSCTGYYQTGGTMNFTKVSSLLRGQQALYYEFLTELTPSNITPPKQKYKSRYKNYQEMMSRQFSSPTALLEFDKDGVYVTTPQTPKQFYSYQLIPAGKPFDYQSGYECFQVEELSDDCLLPFSTQAPLEIQTNLGKFIDGKYMGKPTREPGVIGFLKFVNNAEAQTSMSNATKLLAEKNKSDLIRSSQGLPKKTLPVSFAPRSWQNYLESIYDGTLSVPGEEKPIFLKSLFVAHHEAWSKLCTTETSEKLLRFDHKHYKVVDYNNNTVYKQLQTYRSLNLREPFFNLFTKITSNYKTDVTLSWSKDKGQLLDYIASFRKTLNEAHAYSEQLISSEGCNSPTVSQFETEMLENLKQ